MVLEPLVKPDSTRLLVLKSGEGRNRLECLFQDHQILDRHNTVADYTTISYTWHAQSRMEEHDSVFCDGKVIKFTRNLAELLHRIREKDDTKPWIDQLCINQADEKEKVQHVRLMRNTYQNCSKVMFQISLSPHSLQYGNKVFVLRGERVPFLLRRPAVENEYTMVGECYVHGILHREGPAPGEDFERIHIH